MAEARATERSRAVRADVPKFLRETLFDDQFGQVSFLTENGYRPVRHWYEMIRDVTQPIEPDPLASDLELIRYLPELSEAVREANNDAFRDHWGSQLIARERWERHYTGGEPFRSDLSAVVVDGAKVVGLLMVVSPRTSRTRDAPRFGRTPSVPAASVGGSPWH